MVGSAQGQIVFRLASFVRSTYALCAPAGALPSEYGPRGLVGLYDGEIAFMDEQIGRTLQWLDKNGLREKTIIAVIGDHGEGLGDHGEMTHGYSIYDYAVQFRLLLWSPCKSYHDWTSIPRSDPLDFISNVLQASGHLQVPRHLCRELLCGG